MQEEQSKSDAFASLDELDDAAMNLARELALTDRSATAVLKNLVNDMDISMDGDLLDRAAHISADVISGEETQRRLRELFPEG